mgnify:CR=1 FL=1
MNRTTTRPNSPNRRTFCCGAASLLLARPLLFAQAPASPPATPTRPDVAAIDHDRILAAAARYLTQPPAPLTSLPCPRSPGSAHDYYSEAVPDADAAVEPPAGAPPPFTAHRDALFELGLAVPDLAAAYFLTGEARYAEHAIQQLHMWFLDPATRMTPSLVYAQVVPGSPHSASGRYQGLIEALPLVEIAQAIPFLAASPDFTETDLTVVRAWFAAYLHWLTAPEDSGPRLPARARDSKDHNETSWLLQTAAFANLAVPQGDVARAEDSTLSDLRHHFRSVTLRAQINPDGMFKHELSSPSPYRDSLFNLDMLAGVCQLLSTRFESVWDYQLEDGPSMRAAIAFHFPFIADRGLWPFRADNHLFKELPGRRASLLFSARAYLRPEYATLWKTLPPDPPTPEILRTLPIHQPVLWVRQPPRPAEESR